MSVEDNPKYFEWKAAFEHRNEAERRYFEAVMAGGRTTGEIELAKRDLDKAQRDYDKIVDEIE
jgi:hypothetical protein